MGTEYQGSCHCGKVSFKVNIELKRAMCCNCSICHMKGSVLAMAASEQVEILTGEEELTLYQFGSKTAGHYFCRHCGIHPLTRPKGHPELWAVNLRCLKGIDIDSLSLDHFDGRSL